MRNESKRGGIKKEKPAHGKSSRSPVAARFLFIAFMNSLLPHRRRGSVLDL
jgi:hypothetical protein